MSYNSGSMNFFRELYTLSRESIRASEARIKIATVRKHRMDTECGRSSPDVLRVCNLKVEATILKAGYVYGRTERIADSKL
jgi:hypothetical protein